MREACLLLRDFLLLPASVVSSDWVLRLRLEKLLLSKEGGCLASAQDDRLLKGDFAEISGMNPASENNRLAFLGCLPRRLLARRTDARKLERMAQAGVPALLCDLILKTLDHALVDRFHFMARPADQVVMMMMPVPRPDFVPGRPVDPGDPLHQFLLLENRHEPKNGREVAAFSADLLVNVREGEGNRAGVKEPHDGDASVGGPQAVLPQPRGGVDGVRVRFPLRAHGYL